MVQPRNPLANERAGPLTACLVVEVTTLRRLAWIWRKRENIADNEYSTIPIIRLSLLTLIWRQAEKLIGP